MSPFNPEAAQSAGVPVKRCVISSDEARPPQGRRRPHGVGRKPLSPRSPDAHAGPLLQREPHLDAKTHSHLKIKGNVWEQSYKQSRIFSLFVKIILLSERRRREKSFTFAENSIV